MEWKGNRISVSWQKVNAILVDEAQFLSPEEVDALSDIVDFMRFRFSAMAFVQTF